MKVLLALAAILGIIMLFPILGTLIGCFVGWIVGIFWPNTFAAFLTHFGLSAFAPWQIGALLGFVGGFFKAVQNNNKD